MTWKFIGGIFFGMLLTFLLLGGGGYYYFFLRSPESKQAQPPVADLTLSKSKADELMSTLNLKLRAKVQLEIPEVLKSKIPSKVYYRWQLIGLEKKQLEAGEHLVSISGPGADGKVEVNLPPKMAVGDYRLSIFICENESICTQVSGRVMEARLWFNLSEAALFSGLIDLGKVVVGRYYPPAGDCSQSKFLLSGKVIPTTNFQKKTGEKLALVLVEFTNDANASFSKGNPSDGEAGAKVIYSGPVKQGESNILYSGPLELKSDGFSFSAPNLPRSPGRFFPYAVVCGASESYEACAQKVFPRPLNTASLRGRTYRLIGENFAIPTCGMKDLNLYLHEFPPPGLVAAPKQVSGAPKEIIEGIIY